MIGSRVSWWTPVTGLALLSAMVQADGGGNSDGLHQEYCSGQNTGSDYQQVFNIYQSNGACFDQCKATYAFAIVQYQNCWCSNYIPAQQQSAGDCNQNCPGFPADKCGNADKGLYGYIPLSKSPSGMAGGSSGTTSPSALTSQQPSTSQVQAMSSTSQAQISYVSQTVVQTVTQTQSPSVSVYYVAATFSSSSDSPQTTSSPSTAFTISTLSSAATSSSGSTDVPLVAPVVPAPTDAASAATLKPSPVTSVRVVTVSGAIVTQTVTSTPLVAPGQNADNINFTQRGLSGGAIAGIVIGLLLGLIALILTGFLLRRRRKRNLDAEGAVSVAGRKPASPKRNVSVLSKAGLLSYGRPNSMAEHNLADEPLYATTGTGNNSVRHSMLFGASAAAEGVSPVSPLGDSHDDSRRLSKPLVYDQRLNPSALFANAEANGSRVSVQDNQDYSRPLGIANPDMRTSFDSRISRV